MQEQQRKRLSEYNEIGQLVTKQLHIAEGYAISDPYGEQPSGLDAAQVMDYRYNIRGWLTRMNHSDLQSAENLLENNGSPDLFGFQLGYEAGIGTGNNALYNGNISGMKWSTFNGDNREAAYNYGYDPINRMTSANYKKNSGGTWSNSIHALTKMTINTILTATLKVLQEIIRKARPWIRSPTIMGQLPPINY